MMVMIVVVGREKSRRVAMKYNAALRTWLSEKGEGKLFELQAEGCDDDVGAKVASDAFAEGHGNRRHLR